MPRKPDVTVNAQPANVSVSRRGNISAREVRNRRENGRDNSLGELIHVPSPGSRQRNEVLLERGISVVRPEIIAATEFIPLVNDNDASDAAFTLGSGDQQYRIDITSAARLIEMQLVSQKMLIANVERVLNSYASEDLGGLVTTAQLHLKTKFVEEIKIDTFNRMKTQVKTIIENANILPQEEETQQVGGSGGLGLGLSRGGLSRGGGGRLDLATSSRAKMLSRRFKALDQKYANLIYDYIVRTIIVEYGNEFLAGLAELKVKTSEKFEILNLSPETIDSLADSNASLMQIKEYLRQVFYGNAGDPSQLPTFIMQDYIDNDLNSSWANTLGLGSSTRNMLTIIKSLSADLQFQKRRSVSTQYRDLVPQVTDYDSEMKDVINLVGKSSYSGFCAANYFGHRDYSHNFALTTGGGKSFSGDAYDRCREISRDFKQAINNLFDNTDSSLTMTRITEGIAPLLARVCHDVAIHNNMAANSSITDYEIFKFASSEAVNSNSGVLNIEKYCKIALFDGETYSSQYVRSILSEAQQKGSAFVKQVCNPLITNQTGIPLTILPSERQGGTVDYPNGYEPGPEYYFDRGLLSLASSAADADSSFSELLQYCDKYDNVTSAILNDFKKMRGLGVDNNADPRAEGSSGVVSADQLFTAINNKIADMIELYFTPGTETAGTDVAVLALILMAGKDTQCFANLLSYDGYGEFYQKIVEETDQNAGTNKSAGTRHEPRDQAIHNMYNIEANEGGDQLRQKTYSEEIHGVGAGNYVKAYAEHVSLRSHAWTHLFIKVATEIFGIPETNKKEKKALNDDLGLKSKYVKKKYTTFNSRYLDGKEDTWGPTSFSFSEILTEDFYHVWKANLDSHTTSLMGTLDNFFLNFLPDSYRDSLEKVMGTQLADSAIVTERQKAYVTNGGLGIKNPTHNNQEGVLISDGESLLINTNRGRTYNGFDSTIELRSLVLKSYMLSILVKSLTLRVEIAEESPSVKLITYQKAWRGAVAALRGEVIDYDKHSIETYNNITRIKNSVTDALQDNTMKCLRHLYLLKGQSTALRKQVANIRGFMTGANTGRDYRKILELYNESGIGQKLLGFLSPAMVASTKYNQIALMKTSLDSKFFPPSDVFTSKQLQNMITFFSQKNRGYLAKEDNGVLEGRKSVMHVGIPAGMMENLEIQSLLDQDGNGEYKGSNMIAIAIYRKDVLNNKSYVYPKTFIFDMSRYVLEGERGSSVGQLGEESYLSPDILLQNSNLYKIDGFGQLHKMPAGSAYDSGREGFLPNTYTTSQQDEIFQNHMADHYYKMYFKLMTGLDFKEYVFQLTADSAIKNGPDGSNQDLLSQIIDTNLVIFPQAAEDIAAAREMYKINTGISNTLLFNSGNYMKACLYPNAFDRVFSVMVNERDFVYASGNPTTDFQSAAFYQGVDRPDPNLTCKLEAVSSLQVPLSSITPTQGYYNQVRNKHQPQVCMYYANIYLLKRIEMPDY